MTAGYPPYATARTASRRTGALSSESVLWRLDWILILAIAGLCFLGSLLVYSATRSRLASHHLDPVSELKKHVINIAIGAVLACFVTLFDNRMLRAYAPFIYGASVLGLLAVLSPLGSRVNGAHSWILLPAGFSVQPSEFAKVALCVGLAMILAERSDREDRPSFGLVATALGVAAIPVVLIMVQPDVGTSIVVLTIVIGVLAVSDMPASWLLGLLLIGCLSVGGLIGAGALKDYQKARFAAVLNPTDDSQGLGYQLAQGRIAIGSGGLEGKGLFKGTQTQGAFIPEQDTDFVFTVAGEELGFIGGGTVILLLGLVLWRGLRIALRAEDMFGRLVATGIVCWFTFQVFENIGSVLGIMPMTGVPLPFVSYGGSSMFATMMAAGLLQNVHLRRYA
jgi:rod shape determining protein RodA